MNMRRVDAEALIRGQSLAGELKQDAFEDGSGHGTSGFKISGFQSFKITQSGCFTNFETLKPVPP
jgi:hypothetical protein